jgi:lipid-A-disaccharide synthase
MHKKIFIIAGEPSGDLAGANLIAALRSQSPDVEFIGTGGELMERAGCKLVHKIGKLSVIGFAEVIKKLPRYRHLFNALLHILTEERPDAVILVDFPGFNIRFAKKAKGLNIPVIYYISPQVWAWAKGRVETLKKVVDKMLVLFEFEDNLYRKHGINSIFVGHPLVDAVKPAMSKEEALKRFGLRTGLKTVALLPGSRHSEVKKVLPIMLEAARLIKNQCGDLQFILIKSPIVNINLYKDIMKDFSVNIVEENRYDAMNSADLALVASGTATLETALLGVPMVLVYKVAFLTWLIARVLIKIPYIGLVNIVAGERVVPEFIQFGARPKRIAAACVDLLRSGEKTRLMKSQLAVVQKKLGPPGASQRAAGEIIQFLNSHH